MTRVLYTSWFSPFARKVALALELKKLEYEPIDALTKEFRSQLKAANPRAEVPVLLDDGLVIVNSSDIVQYLDWRYPKLAIYPESIPDRVAARALERLADHRFDPIVVGCSLWLWTERNDQPPAELLKAGQEDLNKCFTLLEAELAKRPKPWPFGTPGLVECAWYANLVAVKPMGFKIDSDRFAAVLGWLDAMREHPIFANDRRRTANFLKSFSGSTHERRRIFWSGDRIEWLMSRGFHEWFVKEIAEGRTTFPD